MSGTFHFELVSPEAKLVSAEVGYVSIPGEEGDFGVLAGHSPLLSSLRAGVIAVHANGVNDNTHLRRFFVAGGFADVGAAHCTVLAEQVTDLALVDVTALDAEIAALSEATDTESLAKLDVAKAKRAAIA